MVSTGRRKRDLARRNSYVGRGEHGIGPPFLGGTSTWGSGCDGRDDAPDYVSHTPLLPGQEPTREGVKWAIAQVSAAISNVSILFEDQVASGEKVVTRFVTYATHDRGELMGVAPSGREMTNTAMVIHRIVGGKIAEEWSMGTMGWELRGVRLEQERIEHERVEQEMRVARRIQQASLPKEVPELEGWEIYPLYRPAREVGGDFYDFHLLPEGRLGLVCRGRNGQGRARCAGHVHHLRYVAARSSSVGLLLTWGGTGPGQRGVGGTHST
jgi:predicted ester cyclase